MRNATFHDFSLLSNPAVPRKLASGGELALLMYRGVRPPGGSKRGGFNYEQLPLDSAVQSYTEVLSSKFCVTFPLTEKEVRNKSDEK